MNIGLVVQRQVGGKSIPRLLTRTIEPGRFKAPTRSDSSGSTFVSVLQKTKETGVTDIYDVRYLTVADIIEANSDSFFGEATIGDFSEASYEDKDKYIRFWAEEIGEVTSVEAHQVAVRTAYVIHASYFECTLDRQSTRITFVGQLDNSGIRRFVLDDQSRSGTFIYPEGDVIRAMNRKYVPDSGYLLRCEERGINLPLVINTQNIERQMQRFLVPKPAREPRRLVDVASSF